MTTRRRTAERLRISKWPLERVADAVEGRLVDGVGAHPTGVSSDSRSLGEGELFFALRGEHFDGHEFVADAADKGAAGAVVHRNFEPPPELSDSLPLVYVDDTRESLAALGHALWAEAREEGLHTVNVTGSNGKTTTKEFLAAIWSTEGSVFSSPGNFNNEIGLPLTLCDLPVDVEHLVVEMGANAPGEIADLVRLAPGDERLVTSIGYDHTEGFGSLSGVRRAKSELFECADPETLAVVPEKERERLNLGSFPGRVWTFGEGPDANLRIVDYHSEELPSGVYGVSIDFEGTRQRLELGFPGRYNGHNLACALSTLAGRGIDPDFEAIQEEISEVELPGGRWRVVRAGRFEIVDDAYNANPTSVRASFSAFLEVDPKFLSDGASVPRIAVLGEMRELGDDAERFHREVARELGAESELSAFIAVGAYADAMVESASSVAEGEDLEVSACSGADEVADRLGHLEEAFVWMKASRANELERVVDQLESRQRDA